MKNLFKKRVQRSVYDSLSTLPLKVWIDIYISGDLKFLIKQGNYTEAELSEIWNRLLKQYQEISGDAKTDAAQKIKQHIIRLNAHLELTDSLFVAMRLYLQITQWNTGLQEYFEVTRKQLANLGYSFTFADIPGDLAKAETRKQNKIIELRGYEKQFIALQTNADTTKQTEFDFDVQIAQVQKFIGVKINKYTDTVPEYMANVKLLKDEIKQQEAANHGK